MFQCREGVVGVVYRPGVVHDGAVVIRDAQGQGVLLPELAQVVVDVVLHHPDPAVPVCALLLMPEAQRMAYLMHRGAKLFTTSSQILSKLQRYSKYFLIF